MIKKNPKVLLILLIATLILSGCNSNQKPNTELKEVEGVEIPFNQQTQFKYIFDDTTSFQIQNIDTSLHKRLIQDALQENLQVYQSDSLTKRGNPYQIAKRLNLLENIKDSALHLDKTKKALAANFPLIGYQFKPIWQWQQSSLSGGIKDIIIEPLIAPQVMGIQLDQQPVFYVALSNLKSNWEAQLYEKFYNFVLETLKTQLQNTAETIEMSMPEQHENKKHLTKRSITFKTEAHEILGVDRMFDQVHQKIFQAAHNDQIKAFESDQLKQTYNSKEIKDRGTTEQSVKYQPNPQEPSVLKDTVIKKPLQHFDIHKYRILEEWQTNTEGFMLKPKVKGLGMVFRPEMEGIVLNPTILFWAKPQAIKSTLTSKKGQWLNKYLYLTLQQALNERG